MKNILSTICFCLISIIAFSQVWTEPVNISNMHAFIQSSDFCIDNSGVFHCVWNKKIDDNHSVLYYSKSFDEGQTWTEPVNISQNNSRYYFDPQILSDSENNLFVVFENYNYQPPYGVYASVISYENNEWKEVQDIAEGLNTLCAIDSNDRLYFFWSQGGINTGEFQYKILENGIWSNTYTPYESDTTLTVLTSIKVDSNDNIHCIGSYDSTGTLIRNPAYFFYNNETQTWEDVIVLSNVSSQTIDLDLTIGVNSYPYAVWNEPKTMFSYYNNDCWSQKEVVFDTDSYELQIELDENGRPFIIISYIVSDGIIISCHYKQQNGLWSQVIIDSSINAIFTPQLIIRYGYAYLVYQKSYSPQDADIYFCRTDLHLSSKDCKSNNEFSAYPNPFSSVVKFTWPSIYSNENSNSIINIYNDIGIIVHTDFIPDELGNIYTWDGIDKYGNKVESGIYIGELLTGDNKMYMKCIKI